MSVPRMRPCIHLDRWELLEVYKILKFFSCWYMKSTKITFQRSVTMMPGKYTYFHGLTQNDRIWWKGTHQYHWVQPLTLHRTPQESQHMPESIAQRLLTQTPWVLSLVMEWKRSVSTPSLPLKRLLKTATFPLSLLFSSLNRSCGLSHSL